jgi:hypothetical protein
MGHVIQAKISQTQYVTVRRDELRQMKEEREQLQQKVAELTALLDRAESPAS